MARVTAFQIEGLKIWFWSCDHEPPHFHVKRRGEWEVKVCFLLSPDVMIEVVEVFGAGPSVRVLKNIIRLSELHRLELLEQWQQIRESEAAE